MKKPLHRVSDHALVRYLERVKGVDMEALRREVGRVVDRAACTGASGVVVDGWSYKIQNGVVTTILAANQPNPKTGNRKRRARDE